MAVIKATKRDQTGSRNVKRMRKQGLIPAIIYGHGEGSDSVTLQKHDVELALLHGERLLELDCEGKTQNVLIKEVQYDTYGQKVLHLDLTRVNLDESVEVTVQVVLRGTPAGVSEEGGMLRQDATEVHLECLVRAIPEQLTIMVNDMKVGDHLKAGDLELPEGAKLLQDANTSIATVTVVAEEVVAEEGEEEASSEPKVIGEVPAEEGEASEE